jgi:hypothetical protein
MPTQLPPGVYLGEILGIELTVGEDGKNILNTHIELRPEDDEGDGDAVYMVLSEEMDGPISVHTEAEYDAPAA